MITLTNYDLTEMPKTCKEALRDLTSYGVPSNLLVQKYWDDELGREGWLFTEDTQSHDLGYQVLAKARENQLLYDLECIEQVESDRLYEEWIDKVSDEIERNWNEKNTIHVEYESYYNMGEYYGV